MKKILSCIFSILIALSQVAYCEEIYTDYDFSDEAQEEFDRQLNTTTPKELQIKQDRHIIKGNTETGLQTPAKNVNNNYVLQEIRGSNNEIYNGYIVTVPEGSTLIIQLQSGVSSGSLDVNDQITATLAENWMYNNRLLAPVGSLVYGVVTDAKAAGYAYGNGGLEINFNKIMTPEGNLYEISTQNVKLSNESTRAKNLTRDILIGAGIGILGGLLGFACTGNDFGRTMAIMGGIGAASGAARGAMQRGQDVNINADVPIQLILTQPVNVAPY